MTNTTLIKIGDSTGITIPARELKQAGLKAGDTIEYSWRPASQDADEHSVAVVELTQKLIARHKKALQNLSQR